jgi:hypothetical protein
LTTKKLLACIALSFAVCAATDDDVARRKASMDAAQDQKDELQDAFDAKSAAKVSEAAEKLVAFGQAEELYWTKVGIPDGVALAQQNLAASKQIVKDAKAGQLDQAATAFSKLNNSCRACHDLHLEKR